MENHVGEELCRLFGEDSDVEWSNVLRRSKDSARRVQESNGGDRPRGPMAPIQLQQQPGGSRRGAGGSGGGGFHRERNQRNHRGGNGFSSTGRLSGGHVDDLGRYKSLPSHKDFLLLLRTVLQKVIMEKVPIKCASVSSLFGFGVSLLTNGLLNEEFSGS